MLTKTILLLLHFGGIFGKFETQQYAMREIKIAEDQTDLVQPKDRRLFKEIVDCGVFCSLKKGEALN